MMKMEDFGGVSGHAGLFSDIGDMVKFSNMLINGGRIADIFSRLP